MTNAPAPELLTDLIELLPTVSDRHSRSTPLYSFLARVAETEAARLFSGNDSVGKLGGPLENLRLPFHKMGTITSLHLFGLDELIIFSFYWANRKRYSKAIDLGANIGLQSIAMSKCGFYVRAFEPDPSNYKKLLENLSLNQSTSVEPINSAVSTKSGEMEFVRVLDNLTGNHLAGAKTNLYGDLEKITVRVDEFKPLLAWADLAKIDVEGHEKELVLSTAASDWKTCDAMMEVGSSENAGAIFSHFKKIGVNMFAQKLNWKRVELRQDMPSNYREGSLFVSSKSEMPWSSRQ